jgi:epoxyqueuosine reductase
MTPGSLVSEIKLIAARAGYVACGITTTEPFEQFAAALAERTRAFPDCAPIFHGLSQRADPRATAPWARSIVVCVRWYGKYFTEPVAPDGIGRTYLFDRRHPQNPDHAGRAAMRQGLRDLGLRVKPGGVPERWAAVRAGVARFGRNCCVYADGYGSWINIESFRVDQELPADTPTPELACPEGCTACLDSCPTGALTAPLVMRADRCVAHLTYEAAHPVSPELWERMGRWVYGCDQCQLVCPLNAHAWRALQRATWIEPVLPLLSAGNLANIDEETYRSKIQPLFWYISAGDVERWRRNARRAVASAASYFSPH